MDRNIFKYLAIGSFVAFIFCVLSAVISPVAPPVAGKETWEMIFEEDKKHDIFYMTLSIIFLLLTALLFIKFINLKEKT